MTTTPPDFYYWHGVKLPKKFLNPHMVETTSGAFTLAVDWNDKKYPWTETDRQELATITRLVLEKIFQRVDQYTPTIQEEPFVQFEETKSFNPKKFLQKLWKRKQKPLKSE